MNIPSRGEFDESRFVKFLETMRDAAHECYMLEGAEDGQYDAGKAKAFNQVLIWVRRHQTRRLNDYERKFLDGWTITKLIEDIEDINMWRDDIPETHDD